MRPGDTRLTLDCSALARLAEDRAVLSGYWFLVMDYHFIRIGQCASCTSRGVVSMDSRSIALGAERKHFSSDRRGFGNVEHGGPNDVVIHCAHGQFVVCSRGQAFKERPR